MSKAITHIRHEITVGRHLHECFCDSRIRQLGWKRIQDARRIARKLKLGNLFA
jgi:hypothetical protein